MNQLRHQLGMNHPDSTNFRYWFGQFFGNRTDSTFSRYSPEFYHFPVLTLILLIFGTGSESFSVIARILSFSGTCPILSFSGTDPDSIIFRYSCGQFFDTSTDSYLFPVLARILSFFGTNPDSTIFLYSSEKFFDTSTDSTLSRYSLGFYHFRVLTLILPIFGTCSNGFSVIARILPFPGTSPDCIIFRHRP